MKKFITILIACSLTLAAGVPTGQAQFPHIKKLTVPKPHVPSIHKNVKSHLNKTVKVFQPRHLNFHARPNSAIVSVTFNHDFRITAANNWKGPHYHVFRTYRPQWHDRTWWHSNHKHVVLIGGGCILERRVLVSGLGL